MSLSDSSSPFGAWWLGFTIISALQFVACFTMALFPKRLSTYRGAEFNRKGYSGDSPIKGEVMKHVIRARPVVLILMSTMYQYSFGLKYGSPERSEKFRFHFEK